jgi:hypothetical protein
MKRKRRTIKGTVKEIRVTVEYILCLVLLLTLLILPFWSKQEFAFAEEETTQTEASGASEPAPQDTDGKYHTPLAGEPLHLSFLGRNFVVPARDRGNLTSVNLGGTVYFPELTDTNVEPLFALYIRRTWERARLRIVASGLVNEADGAKSFGHPEILARFENYTIPFSEKGFRRNEGVDQSSLKWGTLSGFLGAGLRYPVAPYQVDNDLRLQILGRVGYLYSRETSETGPDVKLPPDTTLYGIKLRGRYDGIRRNLMELPHEGIAAGFDLDFVYRGNWADHGNRTITFKKEDTQDYLVLSGYLVGAFGIPGLSEKNRLVASVHGGFMDKKSADRYNVFRLDGGPFAQETDDLHRPNYPGALDTVTLVSKYLLINLEYRRELFPFLYLELRGAFIWGDRATIIASNQIGFKNDNGQTGAIALTTGFLWKSQVYLEYAWDTGFLRDGKAGSSLTLFWSKSF